MILPLHYGIVAKAVVRLAPFTHFVVKIGIKIF